jgi:hypothetical protein
MLPCVHGPLYSSSVPSVLLFEQREFTAYLEGCLHSCHCHLGLIRLLVLDCAGGAVCASCWGLRKLCCESTHSGGARWHLQSRAQHTSVQHRLAK